MTFLNKKQIEKLEKIPWEVKPEGAYLNLFFEDFGNNSAWSEICDQLGADPEKDSITILYFGKTQKDNG
jgi:hypothetical protein